MHICLSFHLCISWIFILFSFIFDLNVLTNFSGFCIQTRRSLHRTMCYRFRMSFETLTPRKSTACKQPIKKQITRRAIVWEFVSPRPWNDLLAYVSSGTLNIHTHSLTPLLPWCPSHALWCVLTLQYTGMILLRKEVAVSFWASQGSASQSGIPSHFQPG